MTGGTDEAVAGRLRAAVVEVGFTYAGVVEVLGATAHAALSRNETLPGLRATTGGSPVATLTRLWLLQAPVAAAAADAALPGLVDDLCEAGVLERSGGEVRAVLDVRPYASDDTDLWVVSDLTPGLDGRGVRVEPDHVLGISPAATSLAQLTVRDQVGSALDLGTGCGVQSLHLATHADRVVATDVNERALRLTRFNLALNEVDRVEVRAGSLFEPVADERFDLVVTNPPFVISPATAERLVYRDSGLPGDRVVEEIVRGVPAHLRPDGVAQVLCNWVITREQSWEERLAGWVEAADLWVVQREVLDLPSYVELWLKDAGIHPSTSSGTGDGAAHARYVARYDEWLGWLEDQGVESIGFGWINLHATGGPRVLRLEEWPYEVEQPLGPEVAAHFDRVEGLRDLGDADLLAARPVARSDVRQETVGAPGAADPERVVLRQQRGMRRARQADTVEAALLGACDGELTVGQILDALAQLLELDPRDLRASRISAVRELVAEGFLELPVTV